MLWLVCVLFGWPLLGCAVLAAVDDDERRLFEWARSAPPCGYSMVLILWPIVAAVWVWGRLR